MYLSYLLSGGTRLNFFLLLLLSFTASLCLGQVKFELYAGVNNPSQSDETQVEMIEIFSRRAITDSLVEISISNYEQNIRTQLSSKIGFEFSINTVVPISDKLSIKSGVGINYLRWSIDRDFDLKYLGHVSTDTVLAINAGNMYSNPCDLYENSYSDLPEVDRAIKTSYVQLFVPLTMEY